MDIFTIESAGIAFIGVVVGFLAGWLLTKSRADMRLANQETTAEVEINALQQTLLNQKREAETYKNSLEQAQRETRILHSHLLEEARDKAVAQSKLEQLEALRQTCDAQAKEIRRMHAQVSQLKSHQTKLMVILKKERLATQEKLDHLQDLRGQMHDTFKALSVKALQDNHQSFLDLASATLAKYVTSAQKEFDIRNQAVEKTVYPLREALDRYEHHLQSMERHRAKAYGGLMQQMDMLADAHRKLQLETGKLAKALRKPHVRGRWGEMTLKRVVELSGMMNRCDFIEQPTKQTEQGLLRPDMVINLPDQRQIIVDAKVPLEAYLEAIEAETETKRNAKLADHLRQLQTHINQLSQKAYWKHFRPTPEFVILFIPGENFYSAALMQRPQLIEDAARKRIVLATPSTLISLLKAVAYGWQQAAAAENARIIADLGRELYDRLSHITQHLNKLGKEIDRSVATYNTLIGSFERRLLTTARKFQGLGVASDQPRPQPALETVKSRPTKLTRDS